MYAEISGINSELVCVHSLRYFGGKLGVMIENIASCDNTRCWANVLSLIYMWQ